MKGQSLEATSFEKYRKKTRKDVLGTDERDSSVV